VGQHKNSHGSSAEGLVQRRRRRADTKSNGKIQLQYIWVYSVYIFGAMLTVGLQ
jgi:hypothetical protein